MSMNEAWPLVLVGLAGLALGLIFFGGLWLTVRRMLHSARPALWMLGSLLLRTAIALSGFWLLGGHNWKRMLVCLAGFFVARLALTWLPGLWNKQPPDVATEDRRASQS
jgi:F1F0 ATPase subunit 2